MLPSDSTKTGSKTQIYETYDPNEPWENECQPWYVTLPSQPNQNLRKDEEERINPNAKPMAYPPEMELHSELYSSEGSTE